MTKKTNIWLWIIPEEYDPEPIRGKWLCFGKKEALHKYVKRLDELVERGRLMAAKISRKLPEHDPFPDKPCVLRVYTSANQQEREFARGILCGMGLNPTGWKSNAETDRDWSEGGKLRKEYLENMILKGCKKYPEHMETLNKKLDDEGNERA